MGRHADGGRVDDDVKIGRDACEVGKGRDRDAGILEYGVQTVGERLALFKSPADDGKCVPLFHEREGDRLGRPSVPEQGNLLAAYGDSVFF